MSPLAEFLSRYASERGVLKISEPRSFQHPEEAYDQQYGIDRLALAFHTDEGNGLLELCENFGYDPAGPILEIGCGTGRLSLSIALSAGSREILITDPSPAFCKITAGKLSALSVDPRKVKVAVLTAEDVSRLPKSTFSVILLRSVLHHILDVARFLAACSETLAPGGVLLFEEPCAEGYLLMGAITQFMPAVLRSKGIVLSAKHLKGIRIFADAMMYYARHDLDKSAAEDKHLFRPDEVGRICQGCNLQLEFFPNRVFANIRERNEPLPDNYFEQFYFGYVQYSLAWDRKLIDLFDKHAREYLRYFSPLAKNGALPYTYGTFLCKRLVS